MLDINKISIQAIIFIYVLNIALPLLLGVLSTLVEFWKRKPFGSLNWGVRFQNKKWSCLESFEEALCIWAVVDLAFLGILTAILCVLILWIQIEVLTIIVISTLLITFGPRFILDICKSLKYNNKTGESETIEELKAKVAELENKVDNQ